MVGFKGVMEGEDWNGCIVCFMDSVLNFGYKNLFTGWRDGLVRGFEFSF